MFVTYQYPRTEKVVYGTDALSSLATMVTGIEPSRLLLLTTPSLAGSSLEAQVRNLLDDRHIGTVSDVAQHVPMGAVDELIRQACDLEPDAIVTLGGGSVTDAAKAVSAALGEGYTDSASLYRHRLVFTYPDDVKVDPFRGEPVPIVSIPTTLSAAEYDGIFGMTSAEGVKDLYTDPRLTPRIVILDPAATVLTPERLWLGTGIRALDHAIETYVSKAATPVTDAASLHAMRMLARSLPETKRDPTNMAVRAEALQASWLSMIGVENVTLGLSHGIGHQIGGLCGVPHGETSCVMLPAVLECIQEILPERLADVARAMGVDTTGKSTTEAAAAGVAAVREFIASLGLPTTLSDVGVQREQFPRLAKAAMEDMVVAFAPLRVTQSDVERMLERAYS